MIERALDLWDMVQGRGDLGAGQVVELCGLNARVYFRGGERIVQQSHLRFLRAGVPARLLSKSAPTPRGASRAAGSRKYPPEHGREQLESLIAQGTKASPRVAKAYRELIDGMISEIGSDWYFRVGFHGQVPSKKTGNLRNCFVLYLRLPVRGTDHIEIRICNTDELPEQHHKAFRLKPKDYHGQGAYQANIGVKELSELDSYRTALLETVRLARFGHV